MFVRYLNGTDIRADKGQGRWCVRDVRGRDRTRPSQNSGHDDRGRGVGPPMNSNGEDDVDS